MCLQALRQLPLLVLDLCNALQGGGAACLNKTVACDFSFVCDEHQEWNFCCNDVCDLVPPDFFFRVCLNESGDSVGNRLSLPTRVTYHTWKLVLTVTLTACSSLLFVFFLLSLVFTCKKKHSQ